MKCQSYSKTLYVKEYNDWTGNEEWVEKTVHIGCEYEDISIHAYKCIKCGHIGYYSGAGKLIETKGYTLDEAFRELDKK